MNTSKRLYKIVATIAAISLLVVSSSWQAYAQEANVAPAPKLVITILDGEGALNDIHQRTAREPIVKVDDENHRPIAGVAILFTLPGSGPSGVFADGAQTFSTVTDSAGRAVAHGLRPNGVQGSYNINVKATYNGQTAQATIHQKNMANQSSVTQHAAHAAGLKTVLIIVAAAAAAGTAVAILETQNDNSTTIAAGPPIVGAPATAAGVRFNLHIHTR